VMKASFAKPQEFDHVRASESDRIDDLAPKVALIECDLHEGHVLVSVAGGRKAETGNSFDDGFGVDLLAIWAPEDLDYGTWSFWSFRSGRKVANGMETFLNPNEVRRVGQGELFNN